MTKAKKVVSTTAANPKKKNEIIRFNLHIGKMIKDHIEMMPGFSQSEFIKKSGKSPTAIVERFKSPYYGTIYDLIDACIICNHDFLSPVMAALKQYGISPSALGPLDELINVKSKNEELLDRLKRIEKDNDVLHEYIIKLKKDTKNM